VAKRELTLTAPIFCMFALVKLARRVQHLRDCLGKNLKPKILGPGLPYGNLGLFNLRHTG
jgi:hypothetical protein